jgi:hypothetical protein
MRTAFLAVLFAGLSTVFFADTSYAQARCGSQGTFNNLESVGLTADNRLVCFREVGGGGVRNIGTIAGLQAGETLLGIDFRPMNGVLYGVTNLANIYSFAAGQSGVINATLVSTLTDAAAPGVPVAINGASFGVDFNPVPDRLRITSDAGQNLRVNVDTGATNIDGAINNAGAPVAGITAVAYTNNDNNAATLTVLNTLNTAADQLNLQIPPNAGSQNAVGALAIDSGVDATFDIFSLNQLDATGMISTTTAIRGLAVFTPAGGAAPVLYNVNLTSGVVTARRTFNAANLVTSIAIPLVQGN